MGPPLPTPTSAKPGPTHPTSAETGLPTPTRPKRPKNLGPFPSPTVILARSVMMIIFNVCPLITRWVSSMKRWSRAPFFNLVSLPTSGTEA